MSVTWGQTHRELSRRQLLLPFQFKEQFFRECTFGAWNILIYSLKLPRNWLSKFPLSLMGKDWDSFNKADHRENLNPGLKVPGDAAPRISNTCLVQAQKNRLMQLFCYHLYIHIYIINICNHELSEVLFVYSVQPQRSEDDWEAKADTCARLKVQSSDRNVWHHAVCHKMMRTSKTEVN